MESSCSVFKVALRDTLRFHALFISWSKVIVGVFTSGSEGLGLPASGVRRNESTKKKTPRSEDPGI